MQREKRHLKNKNKIYFSKIDENAIKGINNLKRPL